MSVYLLIYFYSFHERTIIIIFLLIFAGLNILLLTPHEVLSCLAISDLLYAWIGKDELFLICRFVVPITFYVYFCTCLS
jgi:hypothetical protein